MNEFDSSNSFYTPILKNRSYGLSLYKEATTINPTMFYRHFNEQRKYPRFKPDTKIFVLHSTQGTVDDISLGGLSYTYHQVPRETTRPLPEMSTLFSAGKDYLHDLPCTVVTDIVLRKSYSFFPELKQRRIRFNGLTEKQLEGLEEFILAHALVPASSDVEDERYTEAQGQFDHTL